MNCIPVEELRAFLDNQLPAATADRIGGHLASGCMICRDRLSQVQDQVAATAAHASTDGPDWLVGQAMDRLARNTSEQPRSAPQSIIATLVVDSFATGQLLGFRSIGPRSRHLLYRAGDYDIDLSVDYAEQTRLVDIMGQAMPLTADLNAVAGAEVKLLEESVLTMSTKTNEFGEFIIDGIQQGFYDLRLELKDERIDIVRITAHERPD